MKSMKYIVTFSALALTIPAIGIAKSSDDCDHKGEQHQTQHSAEKAERTGDTAQAEQHRQQQTVQRERQQQAERERQQQTAQREREQQVAQDSSQDRLIRVERSHIMLDDLKNTNVVNRQDEKIGSISDVILDQEGRVAAVVVTSGGLMGIGSKTRALAWGDVEVRAKADDSDKFEVVLGLSKQEFENLPEFESKRPKAEGDR